MLFILKKLTPLEWIPKQRILGKGWHRYVVILGHRVDRVAKLFSSSRNWDSPTPCVPLSVVLRGGGGGTHGLLNSDEGADTVVYSRCFEVLCDLGHPKATPHTIYYCTTKVTKSLKCALSLSDAWSSTKLWWSNFICKTYAIRSLQSLIKKSL